MRHQSPTRWANFNKNVGGGATPAQLGVLRTLVLRGATSSSEARRCELGLGPFRIFRVLPAVAARSGGETGG